MKVFRLLLAAIVIALFLGFASSIAIAQTYTDLHDFNCSIEGCSPQYPAILAQGRDGNIYGTMYLGGTYNYGTVFQAKLDGTITAQYTFDGNLGNGIKPHSGLVLGTDGNFYGTTTFGGAGASGTIFRITPAGVIKTLYSFTAGVDGWEPFAPPIQGKDGNYYGVTMHGTAYKITASGKFTSLSQSIPTWSPAPLIQASDGKFYGVNFQYNGSVFRFSPLWSYGFSWSNGSGLYGPLVQTTDGYFYGTTASGGPLGSASGTVFKLSAKGTGTVTPIHAFDRGNKLFEGYSPFAGLLEATDGNFYGSTEYGGGSCNCGVLFQLTKAGAYKVLHTFDSTHGGFPQATLMQHTNGKIYGLASGPNYLTSGVLYSLDMGLAPFVKLMTTQGTPGQTVEILGQEFSTATSVKFGSGPANFTVVSDTYMTAAIPAEGTQGYVTVMAGSGTLTSNKKFKVVPIISSFIPTSGLVGAQVTITGGGFRGATKVTFGGITAPTFTVDSGSQITATVPAGAVTGKIKVTTPGGTATSKGTFTVN
jgi:uncharacterized repeat protein (TIGR03803 family)